MRPSKRSRKCSDGNGFSRDDWEGCEGHLPKTEDALLALPPWKNPFTPNMVLLSTKGRGFGEAVIIFIIGTMERMIYFTLWTTRSISTTPPGISATATQSPSGSACMPLSRPSSLLSPFSRSSGFLRSFPLSLPPSHRAS